MVLSFQGQLIKRGLIHNEAETPHICIEKG